MRQCVMTTKKTTAAKKAAPKKPTSKKAPAKKTATKKATEKKTPAKKVTAKKPAVKRTIKVEVTPEQKSRAAELVAGVHTLHDEALELAESVLFMADKLKQARKAMVNEPLVIEYDNGGGQSGIRENPHYTAFEKLMGSYTRSLDQLTKIIEAGSPVKKTSSIMAELTTIAGRKLG